MDSTRFDNFTRDVSATNSRRGAVRALAAAGLGLGLTRLGLGSAVAGKKNKHKNNKKKNKKKNKNNDSDTNPNANTKNLLEACTTTEECIGDLLCQGANSQQSCPGQEVGTFCCVATDVQAPCDDSCDCCGLDVICNGGYCQSA